jgi:hypothetical protein
VTALPWRNRRITAERTGWPAGAPIRRKLTTHWSFNVIEDLTIRKGSEYIYESPPSGR